MEDTNHDCRACDGTGQIPVHHGAAVVIEECAACAGTGVTR